jgi:predicted Zn-dependent protease
VYYSEFNKVYRDEIYVWVTQDIEDYEKKNGQMLSPVPKLILNEQMTDIENRIFEWTFESDDLGIDLGATQEGQQKVTGIKNESLPTEAEAKAKKQEDMAREKQESAPPRKLSKKELEIKKIEAETENVKAKTELQRAETEAQNADMKKIEMGLMTKAEFKKKWKGK